MTEVKIKKDLTIESLRGVAIALMVMGHVIGAHSDMGLKVDDGSTLRFIYYLQDYITMPLFTLMSGYVYAFKPISQASSLNKFVNSKVTRLLIPLVVVSTLFFLMQNSVPGTNAKTGLGDMWKIYVFPFAHFWFIQGIFTVFLIIAGLELAKVLTTLKSTVLVLLICVVIYLGGVVRTDVFGFGHVPFLLTFFLLGLTAKRFYQQIFTKPFLIITGILFIAAMGYQISIFNTGFDTLHERLLNIMVGSTACLLLIKSGLHNNALVWLGNYSYTIYLFHVFATAASRIILNKLHVQNDYIQLIVGLVLGLAFPIILKMIIPKNNWLSVALFGDNIPKKPRLINEPAI